MAGYLYYFTAAVVSEEELSSAQLKRYNKELSTNMHVLVLDDEIEVVQEDQQEIELVPPHHHVSTSRRACMACQYQGMNEQNVPTPE